MAPQVTKPLITTLDNPGQICGMVGTKLYIITGSVGTKGAGTKITSFDTSNSQTADVVTGLTAVTACAFDAAGGGDLLIGDGECLWFCQSRFVCTWFTGSHWYKWAAAATCRLET